MNPLIAAVLTPAQQETVDFYRALNVPAQWFIGETRESGEVEVVALGEDFAWSFLIAADGDAASSEATLTEFSTGINV